MISRVKSSHKGYVVQSKDPSFHSWSNPKIRISRKEILPIRVVDKLEKENNIGIGIRRTISMSNTMKIIARRKNRNENGIRAVWFGSNPHSKGEDFSRSYKVRAATTHEIENTKAGIIIAIRVDVRSMIINLYYKYKFN